MRPFSVVVVLPTLESLKDAKALLDELDTGR